MKKIFLVLMLIFAISCGKKEAVVENAEEIYKTSINEIWTKITTATEKLTQNISEDANKNIEVYNEVISAITPLYESLSNVEAPAQFTDLQNTIKEGANANIEMLSLEKELIELTKDPENAATAASKIQELGEKIKDLQIKSKAMVDALKESNILK